MQDRNPYAAPQTNVTQGDGPVEYGEVKIFSVSGRLGRVRYIGYSVGVSLLIMLGLGIVAAIVGAGDVNRMFLVGLAGYALILVVQLMLTIQRAHDMNTTGWLALIWFVPLAQLVFWLVPGTRGENDYGKQPPPNTIGVIVLACVVPLVFVGGILAAIAIPAYQDYTIRAQVSEGLSLAAGIKAAVAEAFARTESAPRDRLEAGLPEDATDTSGQYVTSVDIADGTILINYGANAHSTIAGAVLALQPYVMPDNSVVWRCGEAAEPPGAAALDGSALSSDEATDIGPRYLPSACRP
ncbi:MAG TPA: pilin [Gammaproteobacteria bacterium]|nr:pilin [Gammaproteobacteria bacterium]